ncbi:MAG: hypothetical protein NTX50_20660 [Candidatus Sumerlaeota bacterium]|nr:hypothetical protein [Candidatus Sumerlaeota bacterium]
MKTSICDPVLKEVWEIKDQLARECGYDIDLIYKRIKAGERKHKHRMAKLKPIEFPIPVAAKTRGEAVNMKTLHTDPVMEEIWEIKGQFARECNYDLDEMFRRLKLAERKHKHRLANLKPITFPIPFGPKAAKDEARKQKAKTGAQKHEIQSKFSVAEKAAKYRRLNAAK